MKWNVKKSDEVKERIATDEALMKDLSNAVAKVFEKHKVVLKGMSYVFEPRVFTMNADEAPELAVKAREALAQAVMEDIIRRGGAAQAPAQAAIDEVLHVKVTKCIPQCGGLDPITLRILERMRIWERSAADDPLPPPTSGAQLIDRIVGSPKLMKDFSDAVFGVLEKSGITFKENEGCVFTPFVFETPAFAQKVGVARNILEVRGFGPQVFADPIPDPWKVAIRPRPLPGLMEIGRRRTVGVIVPPWWFIGIPAPEVLRALDVLRQ
ncbi:MAG: hypothetical protein ACM3ON_09580 [Chloroflexota bacterium]